MKLNKLQLKNIIISILIVLLVSGLIITNNYNIGKGFFINGSYLYFGNIIMAILSFTIFIYLSVSSYFAILNVNRFNKYSIHNILNIILLYILIIVALVLTKTINPFIGTITLAIQVVFFILFIYFKGQHDSFQMNQSTINISNALLCLLVVSSCFNNLPFNQFLVPFNIICIVGYTYLLIVNIYRFRKVFLAN